MGINDNPPYYLPSTDRIHYTAESSRAGDCSQSVYYLIIIVPIITRNFQPIHGIRLSDQN